MPEIPSQKRRIFLVDDHPLVCDGLTTLIDRQPDMVVCGSADNAPQALEAIPRILPDAAIVDITLENGSGLELIKDLTACCPEVVLLALSMHDESLYAQRSIFAGARGYVMKREATRKVIGALKDVLAGKLFVSETFARKLTEKVLDPQSQAAFSPAESLSDRELEVFEMIGKGWETRRIAESLKISMKTVQTYCARIKEKLNLRSVNELMLAAMRWMEGKAPE